MTKQCPNCGTEIENEKEKCPKCGYTLKKELNEEETTHKEASKKNESSEKAETTSNFLNKDQNENIEWSELKDMSIGHVMTMFNEQQPEEKITEEPKQNEKKQTDPKVASESKKNEQLKADPASSTEKADELANTAALDQYINEHKNDKLSSDEPTQAEKETIDSAQATDGKSKNTEQPSSTDNHSESTDKGHDEVKSDESEDHSIEPTKNDLNQEEKRQQTEEITRFTKPEEPDEEVKTIGPKALPINTTSEIPSKSKKPNEIEMDAAPIFFKEGEEEKASTDPFEKTSTKQAAQKGSNDETPVKQPAGKNYKKMSLILAAVVVLAGGSWYAYSQTQSKTATGGQVTQKQEELAEQTEKELNSYFTDDKQLFLKPEMVSVSPKKIKENLDTLEDDSNYKKLESVYKKVVDKQTSISKVNELFVQPIVDGNKLKDVAIKADKKIDLVKREEKDDFDKLLNQATDQAISQYDQLQKAKAAVDVFYKDNELTEALTRESYTAAKTEVDPVKNDSLRKPLNDVLVKADKSLTEAEAVAASQQADIVQIPVQPNENQATADQGSNTQGTNGVQPDSNTFSAPNAQGVYTAPVYSVDENDVTDMSNPAWSWVPGIQEKVIATCIERGYIKDGGYSLQPARIINGEGYYNLYGADNQYLVTINAKTGWFKGNASRNAGR
ncbi:hypothetical protein ATZ33_04740 [Enterococcus silesiacus]|uniref:Zinc-ribbon domain-containing protein n=1 Tax=Enterococcus silesiacus TaxID=332949 RepID=A0A0S3K8X9_9ENTE|nr:cell division site-positioning protein MapZ family protein [Enterococcus silesiacus]ALS00702.1 hypothetical protein ATZ33_04740 [Enterococcus silesiacus]OJG92193.1 hypothetical protein RV15_GL003295 [Enterococcus silesiacus]